jgi:hypothetical protein
MEEQNESQVPINVAMSAIEVTEEGKLSRDMLISIPEEFIGSPDTINIVIEVKNYHISLKSLLFSLGNAASLSDTTLISYEK